MPTAYRRDLTAASDRLAHPPVPVHRIAAPTGDVEYARYGSGAPVLLESPTGGHVLVGNVEYLRGVLAEFLG